MRKFEYYIEDIPISKTVTNFDIRYHLDEMGEKGWELVNVTQSTHDVLGDYSQYYYKREIC